MALALSKMHQQVNRERRVISEQSSVIKKLVGLKPLKTLKTFKSEKTEERPDAFEERLADARLEARDRVAVRLSIKTKIIALIFAVAPALATAGCATDKVAMDLTNYLNQGVLNIAELEEKSLARYASVTGANYKDDQTTYEALRDYVIPLYRRFIRGLRALQPETEEVRSLNRIYVEGADSLLEGFKLVMLAIETQDPSLIRPANEYLEKGRLNNERWRNELVALAEKHGVTPQQKKDAERPIWDILLGTP